MAAAWWLLVLTIGLAAAGERLRQDFSYLRDSAYLRPAPNRFVAVPVAFNEDDFQPQVEDDYVQEQPLQPVQIVNVNGRPIGQSKPWFGPAIELEQNVRQSKPFLVSSAVN